VPSAALRIDTPSSNDQSQTLVLANPPGQTPTEETRMIFKKGSSLAHVWVVVVAAALAAAALAALD
jgi:hypothetical protein